MRLKLTLSYDGTSYHGWQVQKNACTVQETLGKAFEACLGKRVDLTGCSRTDTGVHAKAFVCHTDLELGFSPEKLPLALNSFLPDSIALLQAEPVPGEFHARYSVKSKTYRYRILLGRLRDPFRVNRVLFWPKKLDAQLFCREAPLFVGKHDFTAFMASGSKITDAVRTVSDCRAFWEGDELILEITADGFLYHMVRIIVGTLLSRASRSDCPEIPAVLASRDRTNAGFTAPPCGLYLWRVEY